MIFQLQGERIRLEDLPLFSLNPTLSFLPFYKEWNSIIGTFKNRDSKRPRFFLKLYERSILNSQSFEMRRNSNL
ncbi:hypothetical protein A0128_19310 [Leptospira tipperaryensis]|uniref:Uncharacterized protein n=1 Tax=Leptospira tipperaryensis TaxID=2564040 RepID=A0A1D7V1R7_9LEPT|nr:hypothetical protein A0128_19310 [Leptospira tipperaryensis]